MAKRYGVKYDISMSEQKPSTDTIAVNMDNTPFRENGKLLFRPGGHGALIENLNDTKSDVVFVKNIDNVVPSVLREPTIRYKKIIGGVLIEIQKKIAEYLTLLDSGNYTMEQVVEIVRFFATTPEHAKRANKISGRLRAGGLLEAKAESPDSGLRRCAQRRRAGRRSVYRL